MSKVDSLVEARLHEQFQTLASTLAVHNPQFVYIPNQSRSLSGEVRNGVLCVYKSDEEKAVKTLKHELVGYVLTSRVVSPLVGLVNLLIKSKENEIHDGKEKIADLLSKML